MKLLLDTCAALWLWKGSDRLSATAKTAIQDPNSEVVFHQISYLEITTKNVTGKLALTKPPTTFVKEAVAAYQLQYVALSDEDIAGLEKMPLHHRDPFDRLLFSHSLRNGLTLVTSDAMAAKYGVPVIW